MSKWSKFYESRLDPGYLEYFVRKYGPFIDLVKSGIAATNAESISEHGCGIGTVSKVLHAALPELRYKLLDNDKDILSLARQNLADRTDLKIIRRDIVVVSDKADVIHSHGVLEHFPDASIKRIIENQLDSSKILLHYVPSYKYVVPSFGDERLLKPSDWHDICKPTQIVEFNDGYDLILVWK